MPNLKRFVSDNLELVINTVTGEAFASQSALARMVGVSRQSIMKWTARNQLEVKEVQVQTTTGLKSAKVIDVEDVLRCFAKYNPNLIKPTVDLIESETGRKLNFPLIPVREKKKSNKKRRGYIYLFTNEQVLKLGYSANPSYRMTQLQRWDGELEMIAKVEGTEPQEKRLHSLLHQTGEYFGCEWYPSYRKNEILNLLNITQGVELR